MKFLIDMNLSQDWINVLTQEGWEAVHWSSIGEHCATDESIMTWARAHGYVVVTHDLDFSALLAATRAIGPSVIQVRTQDTNTERPETITIGTNELIETDPDKLPPALARLMAGQWKKEAISPLWDGKASERIAERLERLLLALPVHFEITDR